MPWYISIAAAITVAVTAKLIHLFFLSGKTVSNANFFGRLILRIEPARQDFAEGWRTQNWRYRLIVYPCIILTMVMVSALLYWMMPAMEKSNALTDKLRYCLLVFMVGVSASLTLTMGMVFGVYFLVTTFRTWRTNGKSIRMAAPQTSMEQSGQENMVKTKENAVAVSATNSSVTQPEP